MKTALPPWQLTTAELAREITALEAPPDGGPPGAGGRAGGRLAALREERDGRTRLAARLAQTAGQYREDEQYREDDEPW